jgi:hypothetical protein
MNTRNKRASALSVGLPMLRLYPVPDGVIEAEDRVQIVGLYILSTGLGVDPEVDRLAVIALSDWAMLTTAGNRFAL